MQTELIFMEFSFRRCCGCCSRKKTLDVVRDHAKSVDYFYIYFLETPPPLVTKRKRHRFPVLCENSGQPNEALSDRIGRKDGYIKHVSIFCG